MLIDQSQGVVLDGRPGVLVQNLGILVDVSLCADSASGEWVRDRLAKAIIIGHLESLPVRIDFFVLFLRLRSNHHNLRMALFLVLPFLCRMNIDLYFPFSNVFFG